MKTTFTFILAAVLILFGRFVYAQDYTYGGMGIYDFYKKYYPAREPVANSPGMELIKIGGMNLLVPEEMRIYKTDGQLIVEGIDSYVARRFKQTEEHFEKIEKTLEEIVKNQEELKKEIEELKDIIQALQNTQ